MRVDRAEKNQLDATLIAPDPEMLLRAEIDFCFLLQRLDAQDGILFPTTSLQPTGSDRDRSALSSRPVLAAKIKSQFPHATASQGLALFSAFPARGILTG